MELRDVSLIYLRISLVTMMVLHKFAACQDGSAVNSGKNKEVRLMEELFCNYDIDSRPVKNHSSTVQVEINLVPIHIRTQGTNTGSQTVTINSWFFMTWQDEFLTWVNKSEYSDVEVLHISSDKIWVPNIVVFNSDVAHPGSMHEFVTECMIMPEGSVICAPHASHMAACELDLVRWPFDTQNCTLVFRIWLHNGESINLTATEHSESSADIHQQIDMELYEKNQQWELKRVKIEAHNDGTKHYSFPSVTFSFILKRHSAMYAALIIGPAIAMIFMTIIPIALDVDGKDRICLLGVSILCHIMFLQQLDWLMSSNRDSCPHIILFFRDSMVVSVFVLLVTSILRHRDVWSPKLMDTVTTVAYTAPGRLIMFRGFGDNDLSFIMAESTSEVNRETVSDVDQTAKKKREVLKTFANRILFLLTAATYIGLCLALLIGLN